MALSWNEIKDRAVTFSKEWEDLAEILLIIYFLRINPNSITEI